MKNVFLIYAFSLVFFSLNAQMSKKISGKVTDMGTPLPNVKINIKGQQENTRTDEKGRYMIRASVGDWVLYTHPGMKEVNILVEDVTSVLNIEMYADIVELDEIIVEKRKPRTNKELELEYATNKNLVKTTYGILDKNRVSTQMQIIEGKDLIPFGTSFLQALTLQPNFFGRVDIVNDRVYARRGDRIPAIYDLDGMVLTDAPVHLGIDDIDRIAILSGMGVVAKYGLRANTGGIVVINTKSGSGGSVTEPGTDKPYDYAKLRNNIYNGQVDNARFGQSVSKPIKELLSATTEEKALQTFKDQMKLYGSSPYYLMQVSDIFYEKWHNKNESDKILNMVNERFANNAVVLKALAYTYEERGDLNSALELYEEIFILRPSYAQSYRDLANAYVERGEYKKAMNLYARYHTSRKTDTITKLSGIDSMMRTETNNAIRTWAERVNRKNTDVEEVERDFWPIRIVLEWNDSEAEFDVQFVNPENRYFVWSHSMFKTPERINGEKTKGYSSEQFLIDESLPGKWDINVKYLGNKGFEPTYFKMTVYYDYGMPSQRQNSKVFKLHEKNLYKKILSFNQSALAFTD